ncbi:MAG: beta-ketoacyl synthase N-terminal-like domain-containing protein [Flavihumibacter sp.]
MAGNVHIAGTGVISAIGMNLAENLLSLAAGRTGIGAIRRLPTVHQTDFPSGEIGLSNEELQAKCGWDHYPKNSISRTAMLGFLAAKEAVDAAGLSLPDMAGDRLRCGFISATSVGGMDLTEDFFPAFMQNPATGGRLRNVRQHECGAVTNHIANALNPGNWTYTSTISTACSSAANAIMLGARMIKAGRMDMVLAGGTDALSRFTLNGFNTLMILDHALCQPFDRQRRGLNLGEGAGYLLLVSDAVKERYGLAAKVQVTGYANANDAHHQTASSPDGAGSYLYRAG